MYSYIPSNSTHTNMKEGWLTQAEGDLLMSLRSNVTWLYDVVLREMIPDGKSDDDFIDWMCQVCKSLDTHRGDDKSLFINNTSITKLLAEGRWYTYACWVVFSDIPSHLAEMLLPDSKTKAFDKQLALLEWFCNSHNLVLDISIEAAAKELSTVGDEFSPNLHNYILEFLLFEYCSSFVEVTDIHDHLSTFESTPNTNSNLESSLLCWLENVASLHCEGSQIPKLTINANTSLHEAVIDGRLLAVTFFKYDTLFLKYQDLHLSDNLSEQDKINNWDLVLSACKRSKVTPLFTATEIVKFGTGVLRLQLLWLVQMSYVVLKKSCEGILGGCPFTDLVPRDATFSSELSIPEETINRRYDDERNTTAASVASLFLRETFDTCIPLKCTDETVLVSIKRSSPSDRLGFHISLNLNDKPIITSVDEPTELVPGMLITQINDVSVLTCLDVLQAITNKTEFDVHAKTKVESVSMVGTSMQALADKIETWSDENSLLSSVNDSECDHHHNLLTIGTEQEFKGKWSMTVRTVDDSSSDCSADSEHPQNRSETSIAVEDLSMLDFPMPIVRDSIKSLAAFKKSSSTTTTSSIVRTEISDEVESQDTNNKNYQLSPLWQPVSLKSIPGSVDSNEEKSSPQVRLQPLSPLVVPMPDLQEETLTQSPQNRPQQLSPLVNQLGSGSSFAAIPILTGPDCLRDLKRGLSKRRLPITHHDTSQKNDEAEIDIQRGRSSKRVSGARPVTTSCEKHIDIMKKDELINNPVEVTAVARNRGKTILEKINQRQRGLSKQSRVPLPSQRGNKKQIVNAIKHVCLPGKINLLSQRNALKALEQSDAGDSRFLLLLKSQQQPLLRSLYILKDQSFQRVYGLGPRTLVTTTVEVCV